MFEEQVRLRPDAVALMADGRATTYGALNARANRLAHLLAGRGIGHGDRVAVALPGSVDMAATLLAILKSGAAFVPIDPDYPVARIAYMLTDCAPALAIATSATAHLLPAATPSLILDAPTTRAELEQGLHWMAQGKIKAVIDSIYPFEKAAEAHEKMLTGKGLFGKLLLTPT